MVRNAIGLICLLLWNWFIVSNQEKTFCVDNVDTNVVVTVMPVFFLVLFKTPSYT